MKKHNFSAGPSILPEIVKQKSSQAALDYNGTGLSLMEMSHRGKEFVEILDRVQENARSLFNIGDDYAVLFLTGGASSQFFMSALNLYNKTDKISYLDTGAWSTKAIKEAKLYGDIEVVASSKEKNFNYVPKEYSISEESQFFHVTSNNTIYGTQIKAWPNVHCPIISDMSSDIFSRRIPLDKFGLIYAGAQKNVGPAGVSLVIVKKDLLAKVEHDIPTMLNYQTHINKQSAFNTPPVFPIYVTMLTLQWIIDSGGVEAMEKRNNDKAGLLYNYIDNSGVFNGTAAKEDRSNMNATFLLKDDSLNDAFLQVCDEAGIVGIKGHRSVGGFRASIYNAMPKESIEVLIDVMRSFESKYG